MNPTVFLTGKVMFAPSGNPVSDVRVELQPGNREHRCIASAHTDGGGSFRLALDEQAATGLVQHHPSPEIHILKDHTLIYTGFVNNISETQLILLHTTL